MVIRDTEIASRTSRTEDEKVAAKAAAAGMATLTREETSALMATATEGGPIEIPPTPVVKTALLTAVTVLTTLIELGVSVAIIAAIAFELQTLVR
ncbi:MAG: hypothetical protein ACYDGY_02375 [Acidimicrobiales bacterium]